MNNQLSRHEFPSLWFYFRKIQEGSYAYLFYKGNFELKIPSQLTQSKFTGSKVLFILFLHMHYLLVTQQQVQETIDKLSP